METRTEPGPTLRVGLAIGPTEGFTLLGANGLWHAASFNDHLQQTESYESLDNLDGPTKMLLVSCPNWGVNANPNVYDKCPHPAQTNDNGNLQSYAEYAGGPGFAQLTQFSQTFAYDGVNRLIGAQEAGSWGRTFDYDAFENIAVTATNNVVPLNVNAPPSLNQYNGNNQRSDQSYNEAGNLAFINPSTALTYDAYEVAHDTVDPMYHLSHPDSQDLMAPYGAGDSNWLANPNLGFSDPVKQSPAEELQSR